MPFSIWRAANGLRAYSCLAFVLATGCSRYETSESEIKWINVTEGGTFTTLLKDADPTSFRILRHKRYAKDRAQAWYEGISINVADIKSFRSIHAYYAVDSTVAYHSHSQIENSHGPSFEVIKGNWSKDQNDVHYHTKAIGACDPASFEVHKRYATWGWDIQCVFYMGKRLPLKDRRSFQILSGGFSKDTLAVYYEETIVDGADAASFEMIEKTYIGRDKNGCWRFGMPFDCIT